VRFEEGVWDAWIYVTLWPLSFGNAVWALVKLVLVVQARRRLQKSSKKKRKWYTFPPILIILLIEFVANGVSCASAGWCTTR